MMNSEKLRSCILDNYEFVLLDEVDSTNDYAKRIAKSGAQDRTIVIARSQTSGKGRCGRNFESNADKGIFMTLLLMPDMLPQDASRLTLVAAVAVREAIEEETGISCSIKWPNDIVFDNKKLCGILTEMSTEQNRVKHIEVGIGVNVFNESFDESIDKVAISLTQITNKSTGCAQADNNSRTNINTIDIEQLIGSIFCNFEKYYKLFLKDKSLEVVKPFYDKYLLNVDKVVTVIEHNGSYEAIAKGIDADGELIVEKDGKLIKVMSGEVSIRGVFGYV